MHIYHIYVYKYIHIIGKTKHLTFHGSMVPSVQAYALPTVVAPEVPAVPKPVAPVAPVEPERDLAAWPEMWMGLVIVEKKGRFLGDFR